MTIDELDILERIHVYKLDGLLEFLEKRPSSEDFGESLDLYRKELVDNGHLNESKDAIIRGLHLHHQAKILNDENPINRVKSNETNERNVLNTFCTDLDSIVRDKSISSVLNLYKEYLPYSNMYINSEIFEQLYRLKAYDEISLLLKNFITDLLKHSNSYWDNKGACYGAAILANRILGILGSSDIEQDGIGALFTYIIRLAYTLLTRVICWPEESKKTNEDIYELPILHEHRIASLLKRIDLLDRYRLFFKDLIPGVSTVDTLIVSDYYLAHELSFATSTLGRKSEFKRDARNKYISIHEDCIRPYSTCISDGKKDSFELAYRFYLSYKAQELSFSNEEIEDLTIALINNLKKQISDIPLKPDSDKILEYLKSNDIKCFFHFTEEENLVNIRKSRGLFSQRECLSNSIIPKTSGEMRHLRNKDAEFFLEDYVRLSFCKRHPLIDGRSGRLVLLKIKPDVALFESTLFSDRDAALDNHKHGGRIEDIQRVRLNAINRIVTDPNDPDYAFCQAEVMVKSFIPQEYIINLDNPEYL